MVGAVTIGMVGAVTIGMVGAVTIGLGGAVIIGIEGASVGHSRETELFSNFFFLLLNVSDDFFTKNDKDLLNSFSKLSSVSTFPCTILFCELFT